MTLPIFVGWDAREHDAYLVARHSIERRATVPVLVQPLVLGNLSGLFNRPVQRRDGKLWCPVSKAPMATEFACSRFAVPLIQKKGWALFCDCDVLCRADVKELFDLADNRYAVMCVKHKQEAGPVTKMVDQAQTYYNRKNWSSVCLWCCDHPANQRLTSEKLETWPGRDLHAFKWLEDEEIGELPSAWNHLVGVQDGFENAKLLHYTLGTPNMPGYEKCQGAGIWREELHLSTKSFVAYSGEHGN